MRHRLAAAILLLYPRRVRDRHGPELVTLIDDLVAHEKRSRTGLFLRLAADGLVQRMTSTATAWLAVAVTAGEARQYEDAAFGQPHGIQSTPILSSGQ